MIVSYSKIEGSEKSAHQKVEINDRLVGEVWREQVLVVVSKLTEPRRMAKKWRWFAKKEGESGILGVGTRAAWLLGPGFKSKNAATDALIPSVSVPL